MSEKKENIKSGLDISFDGGVVLNSISVAEKKELEQPVPTEEPKITPDVNIESKEIENPVTPTIEAPISMPVAPEVVPPIVMPEVAPSVDVPDLSSIIPNPPFVPEVQVSGEESNTPSFTQTNLNDMNMPIARDFNASYSSSLSFKTKEAVEEYRKLRHEEIDKECDAILEVVNDLTIEKNKIQTIKNNIFGSVFKDENNNLGGMNTPGF